MNDQIETKHCSNCKRDILSTNYVMHSVHCSRNIVLCSKCKEPVPRSEIEDHMTKNHSDVNCEECGYLLQQCDLEDHQVNDCIKRIVKCIYCDFESPWDMSAEHDAYCSSRTELCPKCERYIMMKNRDAHCLEDCSKTPKPQNNVDYFNNDFESCSFDDPFDFSPHQSSVGERFVEMYRNQLLAPKRHNFYPPPNVDASTDDDEDKVLLPRLSPDRINKSFSYHFSGSDLTDPLLDVKLDIENLHRSSPSDRPRNSSDGRRMSSPNCVREPSNHLTESAVLLPCEFCSKQFEESVLIQHQTMCGQELFNGPVPDGNRTDEDRSSSSNNTSSNLVESTSFSSPVNYWGFDGSNLIPCEVCNAKISLDEIYEHQTRCAIKEVVSPSIGPSYNIRPDQTYERLFDNDLEQALQESQMSPHMEGFDKNDFNTYGCEKEVHPKQMCEVAKAEKEHKHSKGKNNSSAGSGAAGCDSTSAGLHSKHSKRKLQSDNKGARPKEMAEGARNGEQSKSMATSRENKPDVNRRTSPQKGKEQQQHKRIPIAERLSNESKNKNSKNSNKDNNRGSRN